jgi:hypothetical protein
MGWFGLTTRLTGWKDVPLNDTSLTILVFLVKCSGEHERHSQLQTL